MIDTKALRNKILDLAISGKLTEQLPEDGNAEDLYVQIQEEKAKLIAEGKIKKGKPLPPITDDEIPFDIPDNWKWVRLKSISQIINGDRGKNYPAKSSLKKEGIPFISALNLNGKNVSVDDRLLCLSEAQYEKLGSGKLIKGDVVICIRGSLGKHGIYQFDKGAIASSLVISRPFCDKEIVGAYEMIWLGTTMFSQEIKKYDGGSAQPNLAANNLEKFLFPLPPLAEQKRIVSAVEDAFEIIDRIEKAQESYYADQEVLKNKIIDAGIRGKLTEQLPEDGNAEDLYTQIQEEKAKLIADGKIKKEKPLPPIDEEEIPFEIPENWKWVRLSEIAYLTSGGQYRETSKGIPYIKVSDMNLKENKSEIITSSHFVSENNVGIIPKNSIIFPKRGGAITTNKKRLILKTPVFVDTNTMGMTPISAVILPYIKLWFDSKDLSSLQTGTSVPQINNKDLYPLLVPLPPLRKQKKIVEIVNKLMSYVI